MTAQIANGGYRIKPKILTDDNQLTTEQIKKVIKENKLNRNNYISLFKDPRNIKIVKQAMFSSTNEVMGTSYKSRIDDPKYQFAGKTGTAQVKRISKRERELDLKTSEIPYEDRDHALYVAFGPYKNPDYALSIIVEHGGSGSTTAAPMATQLFKLLIDRHQLRKENINLNKSFI
jgi:penicillin-binding protein 2